MALNPMVAALLFERNITHSRQNAPRPRRTRNNGAGDALGVVYPQASAAGDTLLRMLVAKTGGLPIVIIGQTFSDAAFMAHPSVYVTGHVDNGDYKTTVERYRVGLLVSIERRGGFALLSWLSAITGRRAAYFDASLGIMAEKDGDLGLSPAIGDSEAVDKLLAWAEAYLRGDVDDK